MSNLLKKLTLLIIPLVMLFSAALPADAYVSVKGYYRKDGTYVRPHVRSEPNGLKYDNYGYKPSQGLYNKTYGTRGSSWDTPTWITDPEYYVGQRLYQQGSIGSYTPKTYDLPLYMPPKVTTPEYNFEVSPYSLTPKLVVPKAPTYVKPSLPRITIPTFPSYTFPITPTSPTPSLPTYWAPLQVPTTLPAPITETRGVSQDFAFNGQARTLPENEKMKRISNEQVELFDKLDSCSRAPSNWASLCQSWKDRRNNFDFLVTGSNDADLNVLEHYFPRPKPAPTSADKPIIPSFGGDCPSGYVKIASGNCAAI